MGRLTGWFSVPEMKVESVVGVGMDGMRPKFHSKASGLYLSVIGFI